MGDNFLDSSNRWLHWTLSTLASLSFLLVPIKRFRKARKEKLDREKQSAETLVKILERMDRHEANLERNTCVTLQTLNLTGAIVFESNLKGECTWVSFEWSNLTGLSLSEARGYGWTQAICEYDVERVIKAWDESCKNHRPFLCRYHYCRKDRTRILVEVRAPLMQGIDGRPIGYLTHVKIVDPSEDRGANTGESASGHRGDGANGGRTDRPRLADS